MKKIGDKVPKKIRGGAIGVSENFWCRNNFYINEYSRRHVFVFANNSYRLNLQVLKYYVKKKSGCFLVILKQRHSDYRRQIFH